jgi:hypothetical protein
LKCQVIISLPPLFTPHRLYSLLISPLFVPHLLYSLLISPLYSLLVSPLYSLLFSPHLSSSLLSILSSPRYSLLTSHAEWQIRVCSPSQKKFLVVVDKEASISSLIDEISSVFRFCYPSDSLPENLSIRNASQVLDANSIVEVFPHPFRFSLSFRLRHLLSPKLYPFETLLKFWMLIQLWRYSPSLSRLFFLFFRLFLVCFSSVSRLFLVCFSSVSRLFLVCFSSVFLFCYPPFETHLKFWMPIQLWTSFIFLCLSCLSLSFIVFLCLSSSSSSSSSPSSSSLFLNLQLGYTVSRRSCLHIEGRDFFE